VLVAFIGVAAFANEREVRRTTSEDEEDARTAARKY